MKELRGLAWAVCLGLWLGQGVEAQTIRYIFVDASRPPGGDGTSWATAYNNLQTGINAGRLLHQPPDQVWVRSAVYTPASAGQSFQLKNGVQVYGGLAGTEDPAEFDLADRDLGANETILSGELGDPGPEDNSGQVVNCANCGENTRLDGFTITGAVEHGVYISSASPTLTNLRIVGNASPNNGAGLYCLGDSRPSVTYCTFEANDAGDSRVAVECINRAATVRER